MLQTTQQDKTIMMKLTIAFAAVMLAIPKFILLPNLSLLSWLGFAILIDLVTGVWKSVVNRKEVTSKRLQETVSKIIKYFGAVLILFIVRNVAALHSETGGQVAAFLDDSLLVFLVYIEVVSILENLISLDRKDLLTRAILIPLHSLLTFHVFNKLKTPQQDQE